MLGTAQHTSLPTTSLRDLPSSIRSSARSPATVSPSPHAQQPPPTTIAMRRAPTALAAGAALLLALPLGSQAFYLPGVRSSSLLHLQFRCPLADK